MFNMNANLELEQKKMNMALILNHSKNFPSKPIDMPRISLNVMTYELNLFSNARPVM